MEQHNKQRYRHDLDGLRGLAIAFVVLFHVFVGRVSGGVDVFLLLSGYFFLGAQLRYAHKPDASLNVFWPLWRTIRRLVPSLVLVLGATAGAVMLLTPEIRNLDFGRQLEASLGYYQNWELAQQGAAYGAASKSVSPLQHLWSMAVQGQFYLLAIGFATVIAFAYRRNLRKNREFSDTIWVGLPLATVTLASLSYATYLHGVDQQLNYYSTFSRLWELCLGALVGMIAARVNLGLRLRQVLGLTGVAMVLSTGFIFDGAQVFPGPAALYPLGGAACVIFSYGAGIRWLGSAPMRWLGKIAYPLYLWHWPMLIISAVILDQPRPSIQTGCAVIAVSLVLAHLTHHGVELPLQQHAKRPVRGETRVRDAVMQLRTTWSAPLRAVGGLVVISMFAAILTVPATWRTAVATQAAFRLDPALYPGAQASRLLRVPVAEPQPDPYLLADLVSPAWTDGCMSFLHDDPHEIANDHADHDCIYGDKDADLLMVVVGGSHAEQWMAPLNALGKLHHFQVIPIVRQGCPAFITERDDVFSPDCEIFNEVMVERLEQLQPDIVFSNSTRPLLEAGSFLDEVPKSYLTLWDYLDKHEIAFVGVRDNPWFLNPDGTGQMVSQCFAETQDQETCGRKRKDIYTPGNPAAQYLTDEDEIAVDTADWFCPNDYCSPVIGNIYVYRDGNHMGDDFALSLAPLLWEEISPVIEVARTRAATRPRSTVKPSATRSPVRPSPATATSVTTLSPAPTTRNNPRPTTSVPTSSAVKPAPTTTSATSKTRT
ncbi:acyltransferase family protein [Corynebacterium sp. HS2168-gen11]|nr:acyltransferase family protein [Corynebacterium sp. HS2168-gen11]MCS4535869.1 acyltransferase family protein [Corynebacterium sp. HS2168-gen11]